MDEIKIKYLRSKIDQDEILLKALKKAIAEPGSPCLQLGVVINWVEDQIKNSYRQLDEQLQIALNEAELFVEALSDDYKKYNSGDFGYDFE